MGATQGHIFTIIKHLLVDGTPSNFMPVVVDLCALSTGPLGVGVILIGSANMIHYGIDKIKKAWREHYGKYTTEKIWDEYKTVNLNFENERV